MKRRLCILLLPFAFIAAASALASCSVSGNAAQTVAPKPSGEQPGPYDVSVSIQYRITLGDMVKDTDPNIIRAARQGIFDYDAGNAHHAHYSRYNADYDIVIFEVDQKSADAWEVRFHEKQAGGAVYPDGYSFVIVTKQQSGSYFGEMINPGGPMIRGDETY